MNVKLTLNVDNRVVAKAKKYAESKKVSVSRLVEEYLGSLSVDNKNREDEVLSPITGELLGMIKNGKNKNYDEILQDALLDKYK